MTRTLLLLMAFTLATVAYASSASSKQGLFKAPYGLSVPAGVWVTGSSASDQIQSKIVVLSRTKRGEEMEVRYRVHFENVPIGKKYRMYLLTGYMEKNGLPEIDLSKEFGLFAPNNRGQIVDEYGALFYRGEWVRIRLRSVDGMIEKVMRFTLHK